MHSSSQSKPILDTFWTNFGCNVASSIDRNENSPKILIPIFRHFTEPIPIPLHTVNKKEEFSVGLNEKKENKGKKGSAEGSDRPK